MRDVHAIGDCSAMGPMLAHDASFQGEMVAEIIAGKDRIYDPVAVPAIVFTEPEIIEVGLAPGVAKEMGQEHGFEVLVGKFPLGCEWQSTDAECREEGVDSSASSLVRMTIGSLVSKPSGAMSASSPASSHWLSRWVLCSRTSQVPSMRTRR